MSGNFDIVEIKSRVYRINRNTGAVWVLDDENRWELVKEPVGALPTPPSMQFKPLTKGRSTQGFWGMDTRA